MKKNFNNKLFLILGKDAKIFFFFNVHFSQPTLPPHNVCVLNNDLVVVGISVISRLDLRILNPQVLGDIKSS